MLRDSLKPLFDLATKLDAEVSKCQAQLRKPSSSSANSAKRSTGKDELVRLNTEVGQLQTDCQKMLSDLTERNKVFEDFQKCLNKSYEYTEACVSLLEGKLALRGYQPISTDKSETGPISSKSGQTCGPSDSAPIAILKEIENKPATCRKAEINDETFYVKPTVPSTCVPEDRQKLKEDLSNKKTLFSFGESVCASILAIFLKQTMENSNMSRSNKYTDLLIKIDFPESPKLPVFCESTSANKMVDVPSPKLPTLSGQSIEKKSFSKHATSFFDAVMSPATSIAAESSGKSKSMEKVGSSLFPELISSPVTPELSSVSSRIGNTKLLCAIEEKSFEFEEDDVVMHSRDSFMKSNHQLLQTQYTPENTVNLLKIRQTVNKMDTPETPDFSCRKPSNLADANLGQKGAYENDVQSPSTPDVSSLQLNNCRSCPMITVKQYEGLQSYEKRLITRNQANNSLKKCYERSRQKPTNQLTISEIESASDLGGKTKCFIYILQSLDLIVKVSGTDMYQILDQ